MVAKTFAITCSLQVGRINGDGNHWVCIKISHGNVILPKLHVKKDYNEINFIPEVLETR